MEALRLLLLILILNSLNCSASSIFHTSDPKSEAKLPKFICNVVKGAKVQDTGLRTVIIATMENNLEHSIIDDTMRCMPMEISVVLIDFRDPKPKVPTKASMVIILADRDGEKPLELNPHLGVLTMNHMSKFFIVTSDINGLDSARVSKFLSLHGIQNIAVAYEQNGKVNIQNTGELNGEIQTVANFTRKSLLKKIYPDKLQNLNGYKYRISVDFDSFKKTNRKNRMALRISGLFDAICEAQNATRSITSHFSGLTATNRNRKGKPIQKPDFIINSKLSFMRNPTSLALYNRNAYCILMPKTKQIPSMDLIVPVEIDTASWIVIVLISVSLIAIWWFYQGHGAVESTWSFTFKVFAIYHGQAMKFSHKNRPILIIMLQIIIFMMFFMNSMYQRLVGIWMSKPYLELKLHESFFRFKQMKGTKIIADSTLDLILSDAIPEYSRFKMNGDVVLYDEGSFKIGKFDMSRVIVVGQCDFTRILATNNEYVYKLPEKYLLPYPEINPGVLSPFADKVQTFITRAFEGGLTEFWETLCKMKIYGTKFPKAQTPIVKDFYEVMTIEKLIPAFEVLLSGLLFCFGWFLCEIFYHGFIQHLSWEMVRNWTITLASKGRGRQVANVNWHNIGRIRRMWYFWRQRRNLRVRRINVRNIEV